MAELRKRALGNPFRDFHYYRVCDVTHSGDEGESRIVWGYENQIGWHGFVVDSSEMKEGGPGREGLVIIWQRNLHTGKEI